MQYYVHIILERNDNDMCNTVLDCQKQYKREGVNMSPIIWRRGRIQGYSGGSTQIFSIKAFNNW